MPTDEEARARALTLLESTHQFPCDYAVTVIAFNRDSVTRAVRQAAADRTIAAEGVELDGGSIGYESRASREGKYLSHRFAVRVSHAGEVLELYARLKAVEGVVTFL